MGILNCKVHGIAGLSPVCKHLAQDCSQKITPARVTTVLYYFGNFFGKKDCPLFMGFSYCDNCAHAYNLPMTDAIVPEDEFDAIPDDIIKAVCGKCFNEIMAGTNWRESWKKLMAEIDSLSQATYQEDLKIHNLLTQEP